jgi:hypothetical protein
MVLGYNSVLKGKKGWCWLVLGGLEGFKLGWQFRPRNLGRALTSEP